MNRRTITTNTRAMTDRIRATIRDLEPTAQVILYGSRARGEAGRDSDWDLLILVDGPVSREREQALTDELFDLELETNTVLSSVVISKEDWTSPIYQAMPFHENVAREGIPL